MKKIIDYSQKHPMIIVALIILIAYIPLHLPINVHSINYWNMFWTMIAAFSIPTSLFIFYREEQIRTEIDKKQQETNRQQQIKERLTELIQKDIPEFWTLRQQYNYVAEKYSLSNAKNPHFNLLIEKGISLLFIFSDLNERKILKKNKSDDLSNYATLVCEEMNKHKDYFIEDFEVGYILNIFVEDDQLPTKQIHKTRSDESNQNDSSSAHPTKAKSTALDSSEILIVRTTSKDGGNERILGDWKLSFGNAKNIKYIVGVVGFVNSKKTFNKVIHVSGVKQVSESRVRFIADKSDDSTSSVTELLNEILDPTNNSYTKAQAIEKIIEATEWKGINPTVYLSHLEEVYKKEKQTKDER